MDFHFETGRIQVFQFTSIHHPKKKKGKKKKGEQNVKRKYVNIVRYPFFILVYEKGFKIFIFVKIRSNIVTMQNKRKNNNPGNCGHEDNFLAIQQAQTF